MLVCSCNACLCTSMSQLTFGTFLKPLLRSSASFSSNTFLFGVYFFVGMSSWAVVLPLTSTITAMWSCVKSLVTICGNPCDLTWRFFHSSGIPMKSILFSCPCGDIHVVVLPWWCVLNVAGHHSPCSNIISWNLVPLVVSGSFWFPPTALDSICPIFPLMSPRNIVIPPWFPVFMISSYLSHHLWISSSSYPVWGQCAFTIVTSHSFVFNLIMSRSLSAYTNLQSSSWM